MEQKSTIIPAGRQQKIIEYVKEHKSAQIKELAEYLEVSDATVRRDLDELDAQGHLVRTHGGAVLKDSGTSSFERQHKERPMIMPYEKRRIAKKAASFISEGETILLDSGTTTYYLSSELSAIPNLTVITYDLFIASNIVLHSTSTLIVTGGLRRPGYNNVLWGSMVEDYLRGIRVDKAFLGADAIDLDFGVSNTNVLEVSTKKRLIEAGKEVILVADHSKLERVALAKVCNLSDIDTLVMDKGVNEEYGNRLKKEIGQIHLV